MTTPTTEELLDRITATYQQTRETDFGDVCHRIVTTAAERVEYHADDTAEWELDERNLIGIAVRHLQRNGIIEPTGEHRPAASPASHGRRSYVYRLTVLGKRAAAAWPQREPTPRRIEMVEEAWPATVPAQTTLDLTGATA